jgi:tetratricopeptide (TPR) repeat protein
MVEGRCWLEEALERAADADPQLRAQALSRLGSFLLWLSRDVEPPRRVLTEALELAHSVKDTQTVALSLSLLGVLGLLTQDWNQSRRHLEEALAYWKEAGHTWGIASALLYPGTIEARQGYHQEAVRLLEESAARHRETGDASARGLALAWLVYAAGEEGEVSRAMGYVQELYELGKEAHDRRLVYLCGIRVAWLLRHADRRH